MKAANLNICPLLFQARGEQKIQWEHTSQLPLKAHLCSRVKAVARVGLRELAAATILSASNIINAVPGGVADSHAYSDAA